ncbi:hypothetical protein BsIDN1_32310 [Bacillus safensis]|uniref:Uncharacterized protein n=1 Tax=Bacillus safensis TaxID=561879 RepID=A0A5S9M905_BACIA|nr:hypothetical protein BsIDN1_32310 [Bacillus safensis]
MIFGTAGFTAALSIMALQENGMNTKNQPNIYSLRAQLVELVASLYNYYLKIGYKNIFALVRKDNQVDIAKSLGANDVIFANQLGELKNH